MENFIFYAVISWQLTRHHLSGSNKISFGRDYGYSQGSSNFRENTGITDKYEYRIFLNFLCKS